MKSTPKLSSALVQSSDCPSRRTPKPGVLVPAAAGRGRAGCRRGEPPRRRARPGGPGVSVGMRRAPRLSQELVSSNPNQRNWRGIMIALLVIVAVLALIVTSVVLLTPPDEGPRVRGRRFRLGDILGPELAALRFNGSWVSGEELLFRDQWGGISLLNAANLTTRTVMSNTTFKHWNPLRFTMSPDHKYILMAHNVQKLFRYSYLAQYTVYDIATMDTYPLSPGADADDGGAQPYLLLAAWVPRGLGVVMVHNYDIYYRPDPAARGPADVYVTAATWVSETSVAVVWLNRPQNLSLITVCKGPMWYCMETQRVSGEGRGWVDAGAAPLFSADGSSYVTLAPVRDGAAGYFRHVVHVNVARRRPLPLTRGRCDVVRLLAWDHADQHLLSLGRDGAAGAAVPIPQRHLQPGPQLPAAGDAGRGGGGGSGSGGGVAAGRQRVGGGAGPGLNVGPGPGAGPGRGSRAAGGGNRPRLLATLQNNSALVERASKMALPQVKTFPVQISGGYHAQVRLHLPPGLREDEITRYPLVVQVYLRDSLHFVDPRRVAVWGWSYGGFVAAMALAREQDVFHCGISVAPVTTWRLYDSAYTERYMGLPNLTGNYKGYEEADVSQRVERLRDKMFYLVHGTADDNVHFQQSMALARALANKGVLFRQQVYPDESHSLSGVKRHLYRSMANFLDDCFRKQVPPDQKAGLRNGGGGGGFVGD
ncbi:Venom dipeptidyl peptidase 4 [Gryllus bimaculatus]|nr:Venom dipeptidyl peptidase 4 [Gryllus bimaculatus]